jgi:hypothetical protein
MQKEGINFGQLVLLYLRKQSKEEYSTTEKELEILLSGIDSGLVKTVSKMLSCEPSQLARQLLFEGIKDSPLPYKHLSVMGMSCEKYHFVISKGRAGEIINCGEELLNGKYKEYNFYAQKFASQLRNVKENS